MEGLGHSSMSSYWVVTKMQMQFMTLILLSRVGPTSAKAVTIDVVDVLVKALFKTITGHLIKNGWLKFHGLWKGQRCKLR